MQPRCPRRPHRHDRSSTACGLRHTQGAQSTLVQAIARGISDAPLCARHAVDDHDVGGEVVLASDQRGPDAVGVDRHPAPPRSARSADASKPPLATIRTALEPLASSAVPTFSHQLRIDAAQIVAAHLVQQRAVDSAPRCRAARPTASARARRATSSAVRDRVVVPVDQHGHVHLACESARRTRSRRGPCHLRMRRSARAAPCRSRHRPTRMPARRSRRRSPRRRARSSRLPSAPASGRGGRGSRRSACRRRPRTTSATLRMISDRRASDRVDGLEMREQGVIALDRHHRFARRDRVALVQRVDVERLPA